MLLKPLSGEDSQGKINLSILTLWVIIDHWTKSFGFCMDFMVAQKDMIILERSCIKSMLIDGGHNQNTIILSWHCLLCQKRGLGDVLSVSRTSSILKSRAALC